MEIFLRLTLISFLVLYSCYSNAAVVLLYHHVSNTMPKSTSISPEDFEAHLNYLEQNNFSVEPLTELVELIRQNKPLPDKTVAISFDDSYRDVYESAYPILKKRNWPFTFFVNIELVGKGKLFVTWDQLREMSKNGITIANHSTEHNHMVRLRKNETLEEWKQRSEKEINDAQQKIEHEIGFAPKIFAYPYGEYNTDLKSILSRLGYISFTQQAGGLSPVIDKQILPRFPFGGSYTKLDDFKMKVNSFALPVTSVRFFTEEKQRLATNTTKEGDKPWFEVEIWDKNLVGKVNCYLNGAPLAIEKHETFFRVGFTQALKQGRTKVTCTAPSQEKGRYYWFTQLWLVADEKGEWQYAD